MFVDRWSPRSFLSDPIPGEDLDAIFEAARWAFSSNNAQPWMFLYETDGPDREAFLSILSERNRDWAKAAPVIGLIVAITVDDDDRAHPTARFDTGAAAFSMALQAHQLGYSAHLMAGIDRDIAYEVTGADTDRHDVIAAFVLGRRGPGDELHPKLAAREHPSDRKPTSDIARQGVRID
jgi:nitroreductase